MSIFDLRLRSTNHHKKYWQNRVLDWEKERYTTWNHPHRFVISAVLKTFNWFSLLEVGCGAAPNLVNIVRKIGGKQLGGIDINPQAIEAAQKILTNGFFKVNTADDIMMSDKCTDVVLTDMCLIYYGPRRIKKVLQELKRIGRTHLILCEFHSTKWWKRQWLRLTTGYHSYNYKRLLKNEGFYDILSYKLKPEDWDGFEPQRTFGYIFVARIPKY